MFNNNNQNLSTELNEAGLFEVLCDDASEQLTGGGWKKFKKKLKKKGPGIGNNLLENIEETGGVGYGIVLTAGEMTVNGTQEFN